MGASSRRSVGSAFLLITALVGATACGGTPTATAFEDVEDLISSMEAEGHECSVMSGGPVGHGGLERGENALCAEGYSVMVWEEDFTPGADLSETDPLVSAMAEQGALEHLRGPNWHVMSAIGEDLDELQQALGGERNEHGPPDLNQ